MQIDEKYKNTLLLGDTYATLTKMPDSVVDLTITSPPYNKQEKNNGGLVNKVIYDTFKDRVKESEYQQQQIDVLNEIFRITKTGGSLFYNHKIRWEKGEMFHPMDWLRKTGWTIRQELIWDRTIAGNIRGWRFWQVEERIYWLYKPINSNKIGKELASKDAKMTSIWRHTPENNNPHPAPFPVWLPTRIIVSMLDKDNGFVLDPYVGSGTTCLAAKLLNHNYLGIDISETYIDYAQNRIKNSHTELSKVLQEKDLHKVEKTFKQRKINGEYKPKKMKKMPSKQQNFNI